MCAQVRAACACRFTQSIPDSNEISEYYQSENYISHSDTKKGLINSLYHIVRKMTLEKKRNLVKRSVGVDQGKILDVGCGTGAFLHAMQLSHWEITGLEPDNIARKKARELYGIVLEPSEKLIQLPVHFYDAITMWHVLEHVHQLHEYIERLKLLLAPGGKIFIAVPNYTSYDATIYKNHWAGYDVPRHLYHFSPVAMSRLLTQHGLTLENIKPMWFDSYYVSMLSEKYKSGRNNLIRACWNGYVSNVKAYFNKEKCSSLIYIAGSK